MGEITKGELPEQNEGGPSRGPLDIPALKGQEKPIEGKAHRFKKGSSQYQMPL